MPLYRFTCYDNTCEWNRNYFSVELGLLSDFWRYLFCLGSGSIYFRHFLPSHILLIGIISVCWTLQEKELEIYVGELVLFLKGLFLLFHQTIRSSDCKNNTQGPHSRDLENRYSVSLTELSSTTGGGGSWIICGGDREKEKSHSITSASEHMIPSAVESYLTFLLLACQRAK